jgi:hypothetical protein
METDGCECGKEKLDDKGHVVDRCICDAPTRPRDGVYLCANCRSGLHTVEHGRRRVRF